MEVVKEDEIRMLDKNCFKTSFNKQDVSNMKSFIEWKKMRQRDGNKIVRCPICWSYEINENIYIKKCENCHKNYCQRCNKIVYGDHDHVFEEGTCCKEFWCGLKWYLMIIKKIFLGKIIYFMISFFYLEIL